MRPRGNEFGVFPKNTKGSIMYYYWVYDINGKRRRRTTGKRNRDDAVKYCRTLQIKGQLLNGMTLSFNTYTENFFDYENCPYINHRLARGFTYGRPWAKRQKGLLDTVIRPYFEQKTLDSITFHDIDEFVISLKKSGYSNKKLNHIISTLRCIFSFAEMNKEIETNPCKGLKSFKIITPEKGILTKAELEILFSEERRSQIWPEQVHFAINYIASCTGLRIGEILALRPGDYSDGVLTVSHSFNPDDGLKPTKNGKSRSISLDKTLEVLFMGLCQGRQEDEYIFSTNNGVRPMDHKTIYKRFWKALESIGIDEAERKRRNISFHSYRHGVNTMLLESGIAPETVRLLTGHSAQMTARYSHLQLPNNLRKSEDLIECSKNDENNYCKVPKYIEELIDRGFLFPDGKKVTRSLDEVAYEMKELKIRPTAGLLRELFLKTDGKEYSQRACKKAINFAYSK